MFKRKKLLKTISKQQVRIAQLEDIICPCQSHEFVGVSSEFVVTSGAPIVDGYTETTLQCKKCKKIVHSGAPLASKYY